MEGPLLGCTKIDSGMRAIVSEKSMWIIFAHEQSWSSDQRMLWRSWGQLTVLLSQSMRKFATSKPSSALACQVLSL